MWWRENNISVVVVGGGGDCGGGLSGRKKRRLTELKRSKITNCREEGRELALVKKMFWVLERASLRSNCAPRISELGQQQFVEQ